MLQNMLRNTWTPYFVKAIVNFINLGIYDEKKKQVLLKVKHISSCIFKSVADTINL